MRSSYFVACFVWLSTICFVRSAENEINLNSLADPVFDDFRSRIVTAKLDKVPVSNLQEDVKLKVLGYNWSVFKFQCDNGWVKNISSIRRAGDIITYKAGDGVAVEFPFGFDELQYTCDSYMLNVPVLKFKGKLNAKVGYNAFDLKVIVEFVDEVCHFKIDRFSVKNLDDIKVRLTGFSVLNNVLNKAVTGIAKMFKEALGNGILNELKKSVIKAVEDTEFCRHNNASVRR